MKKFPLRKLSLMLLISVFVLSFSAFLSACGLVLVPSCLFARAIACEVDRSCEEQKTTISYALTDDGYAYKVVRVGSAIEDVIIPETYEGLPVTIIADGAFRYQPFYGTPYGKNFKSLTLPSSITTIEYGAFSVGSNSSSGPSYFNKVYYNGSLEQYFNINFGDRLLYCTQTLYIDGEEVEELIIPDGFAEVPQRVFAFYNGLKSVTLPQSVKVIGDDAFYECANLQSLTLSDNLQSIGDRAFAYCTSLASPLNCSQNLLSIGSNAFVDDGELTEITFHPDAFVFVKESAFMGCGITSLDIPYGVRLGKSAFANCSLQSLKIACPIVSESAFRNSAMLSEIEFAESVQKIENSAFRECSSLQTLDLSQTQVQSIYEYAFDTCDLHLVYLPKTLEHIHLNCLFNNPRLYEIYNLAGFDLPEDSTIVNTAKVIHTSLSEPLQVECREGWYFFNGENGLELFACEDYVLEASYNVKLPETEQGYTLTCGIFDDAYVWTVEVPSCVKAIGESAFLGCQGLTEVIFSEGLESIGEYAFANCIQLKKAILPEGLKSLGDYVYYNCQFLETLCLPSTLTNFNAGMLEQCWSVSSITINGENPYYYTEDNCIVEMESKTLIYGTFNSEIPDGITAIGDRAFYGSDIRSVIIPEGVTAIGAMAFEYCKYLSEISLPSTLERIERSAFSGCEDLKNITFPKELKHIGGNAFANTGLTRVTIPENVTELGNSAFQQCQSLIEVVLTGNIDYFSLSVFWNCQNLQNLFLPEEFNLSSFFPHTFRQPFNDFTNFTIHYNGTKEQWLASASGEFNDYHIIIECSDGAISYPNF